MCRRGAWLVHQPHREEDHHAQDEAAGMECWVPKGPYQIITNFWRPQSHLSVRRNTYFRGRRANLSVRPKLILPQHQLLGAALVGSCYTDFILGAKVSASPVIFPFADAGTAVLCLTSPRERERESSAVVSTQR
jgi:hypothetical protein